jgi:hypothetical protein
VTGLAALAPYARRARAPAPGERCELCSEPLGEAHPHAVDLDAREVCCVCLPCAILFRQPGAGRWRTVPDRVLSDPSLQLDDGDWTALGVPVRLAFVVRSSRDGTWTALYPSPAGPAASEVPSEAWAASAARTRLVRCLEPDVEALLVHRPPRGGRLEVLLAPIDACYGLVGLLRRRWRGLDGGDEVRAAVDTFLDGLRARARALTDTDRGGSP